MNALPRLLLGLSLVASAPAADQPAAAAPAAAPPITVIPATLREDGLEVFDQGAASSTGTTLMLSLTVNAGDGATILEAGNPTVELITLDDGRTIDHPPAGRAQQMWGGGYRMMRGNQPLPHPQIALPPAVRGAKAIKALKATLPCTWATGRRRATLAPLRDHLGKRIRIAAAPGEPVVRLTRTGDQLTMVIDNETAQMIAEFSFTDAAGGELKPGSSGITGSDGNTLTWSWTIANLPDDLAMRIDFWREVHRDTVPFTLADLRLFESAAKPADDF